MIKKIIIALSFLLAIEARNVCAAGTAPARCQRRPPATKTDYQEFIRNLKIACESRGDISEPLRCITHLTHDHGVDSNDPFICSPTRIVSDEEWRETPSQNNQLIASLYDFPKGYDLDDIIFYTPLMYAITRKSAPVVQALLNGGAQPWATNQKNTPIGWTTPMHLAAHYGAVDIMGLLYGHVEVATLVNQLDYYGHTPLHVACTAHRLTKQIDAINFLLAHGAQYDHVTPAGENVLHILARDHKIRATRLSSDFVKALHIPTPARHRKYAPPGSKPEIHDNTPLHIAAQCLNIGLVEDFLTHGANHTKRNSAGHTPLQFALTQAKLTRCPLAHTKQDLCHKNHFGKLAHTQKITAAIDIIKLFLAHGATLTEADLALVGVGSPVADQTEAQRIIRAAFNDVIVSAQPAHQALAVQETAAPASLRHPPTGGVDKSQDESDADLAGIKLAEIMINMTLSSTGSNNAAIQRIRNESEGNAEQFYDSDDSPHSPARTRCTCRNWLYKLLCCQCCYC